MYSMKRKVYILTDSCSHNYVFFKEEIKILREKYDVTIVGDDIAPVSLIEERQICYNKDFSLINNVKYFVLFLINRESWIEIINIIRARRNLFKALLETIRFYINSEYYYRFLIMQNILSSESNAIFYSYWYFWKCFAVTNHRKEFPDIRVITRTHGYDLYRERLKSGWQPYKSAMDSKLDNVVFVSDYAKDYYFKTYDIKESDKHKLYYLGVKGADDVKYIKRDKVIRIVSCSNVIELKRVDYIVKILSEIDDINIDWIHFGEGNKLCDVKSLAKNLLSNKPNINYNFAGYTDNSEIIDYYQNHSIDLFIHMSSSEGGNPLAIQEALSFGIPVLAAGVCNIPNMLEGKAFVVSENPTIDECVKKIYEYNSMTEQEINVMRNEMRDIWLRRFNAEVNGLNFVREVVDNLL